MAQAVAAPRLSVGVADSAVAPLSPSPISSTPASRTFQPPASGSPATCRRSRLSKQSVILTRRDGGPWLLTKSEKHCSGARTKPLSIPRWKHRGILLRARKLRGSNRLSCCAQYSWPSSWSEAPVIAECSREVWVVCVFFWPLCLAPSFLLVRLGHDPLDDDLFS